METRTELILLQRTMVVVEGVARGLDPHINIWQVAKPVVESYVSRNVGPLALLRDLAQTARVLGRFGPRLPRLVEAALIRQAEVPHTTVTKPLLSRGSLALLAAALFAAGLWIGAAFL